MNVIEKAVAPLKNDAMDRAEKFARQTIEEVTKELAAAGNDLNVCAPYPKAWSVTRNEYMRLLAKYQLFSALAKFRKSSYSMNEPRLADVSAENAAKFVAQAREDAAFQYEAFVAKLNKKIGPATAARLQGNHVWGYSFLHVTTAAGEQQIWKTQMIVNVSKLGKIFNQFPTRKVKAAK